MLKWIIGFVLTLTLFSCAPAPAKEKPAPQSPAVTETVESDEEFRTLENAVAEANRTFPQFVKAFETQAWGEGDYVVRLAFYDEKTHQREDLFVTFEGLSNNEISGTIESVATILKQFKLGAKVTKPMADLQDWMFIPESGDHRGGYTLRILPEEETSKSE